jgi:hypothetical protein
MLAMRLLMVSVLLAGTALPTGVWAQTAPASKFAGWLCEIDLAKALAGTGLPQPSGPSSVFTTDSLKLCTGSSPSQNVQIECKANVPEWVGGSPKVDGFPCQIYRGQCGMTDFVPADNSSLTIDAAGNAKLTCHFNKCPPEGC